MWFDLFITATALALGSVLFGHFETDKPAGRRVFKLGLVLLTVGLLSAAVGHVSLIFLGVLLAASMAVHVGWCRRYGIDPITAEPRDKLRELLIKQGYVRAK
jgi:hypothetical protein